MANDLNGIFQTLILPATASLQRPNMLRNSMLAKVYVQRQPQPGTFGKTINVNVPIVDENDVIDIGNGPIQLTDEHHNTVPLDVNRNMSTSLKIPEFDQVRTPLDFRDFYLAPRIESVSRKINRTICNLVTATNFSTYTSVVGGDDVFTRPNVAKAWQNLTDGGVPFVPGDMFFVTGTVPYANMIGDDTNKWIQENVVGVSAAEAAQQTARRMPVFGAVVDFDPMMPKPAAGTYAGLFFNRNAIAAIPVAPPASGSPLVRETYFQPEGTGWVYRIQFWYDPREQAWILHVNAIFALAVVRPDYGSYLVTT
jgi:hypothetical protein